MLNMGIRDGPQTKTANLSNKYEHEYDRLVKRSQCAPGA